MSDKPSHSRIRIALAQFCYAQGIDVTDLFGAMGMTGANTDPEAMAHLAGVIDGMNIATSRIRDFGVDNWAKGN